MFSIRTEKAAETMGRALTETGIPPFKYLAFYKDCTLNGKPELRYKYPVSDEEGQQTLIKFTGF